MAFAVSLIGDSHHSEEPAARLPIALMDFVAAFVGRGHGGRLIDGSTRCTLYMCECVCERERERREKSAGHKKEAGSHVNHRRRPPIYKRRLAAPLPAAWLAND